MYLCSTGDVRVLDAGELLEALQQGAAGQGGARQGEGHADARELAAAHAAQAVPGRHLRQRRDHQPSQPLVRRQSQNKLEQVSLSQRSCMFTYMYLVGFIKEKQNSYYLKAFYA